MVKRVGDVEVNLENSTFSRNGVEIENPHDIFAAYEIFSTFEYLKDNYDMSDDILWDIAAEVRNEMTNAEANGHPQTEGETILEVCKNHGIELKEATL